MDLSILSPPPVALEAGRAAGTAGRQESGRGMNFGETEESAKQDREEGIRETGEQERDVLSAGSSAKLN